MENHGCLVPSVQLGGPNSICIFKADSVGLEAPTCVTISWRYKDMWQFYGQQVIYERHTELYNRESSIAAMWQWQAYNKGIGWLTMPCHAKNPKHVLHGWAVSWPHLGGPNGPAPYSPTSPSTNKMHIGHDMLFRLPLPFPKMGRTWTLFGLLSKCFHMICMYACTFTCIYFMKLCTSIYIYIYHIQCIYWMQEKSMLHTLITHVHHVRCISVGATRWLRNHTVGDSQPSASTSRAPMGCGRSQEAVKNSRG